MPLEGEYEPSPWAPVAEQVRLYEGTWGGEGGTLEGKPCVVLTTRGRKTGSTFVGRVVLRGTTRAGPSGLSNSPNALVSGS